MCMHCYSEKVNGGQYTEPVCASPRDGLMSRQSGWYCAGCGHWHGYPRPSEPTAR